MNNNFRTLVIDDTPLDEDLRGGVVAIGNFDGFHRGHRTVVDETLKIAEKNNCPAILLTFDPHPRTWFNPENPVYLLTPPKLKSQLAQKLGFSAMAIHSFNAQFAALSADEFLTDIVVGRLDAAHVVTGYDFHFGAKRQGTPKYLVEESKIYGFDVSLMGACRDENNEIISSSRIRKYLCDGDLAAASGLLGYAYQISGTVITGKKLGHSLGFPTANIVLPSNVRLRQGIYAVRVVRENGDSHDGVASFGRRPTFDNGEVIFETFLFDFDGDLYGEELTIILYSWLREEQKFENAVDLVAQMNVDKDQAQQYLATLAPEHMRWPLEGATE